MLSLRTTFASTFVQIVAASSLLLLVACGGGGAPDPKPPSDRILRLDDRLASFRSEEGLTAAVDANGHAVPGGYEYASEDRLNVSHGAAISKVATRLGWTGTLTPADLEGANTSNIPALRIVVPYGRYERIASALATVAVSCQGCTFEDQAVDLSSWTSTLQATTEQYLLLPLATNTIPALGALPAGTTQVELEITAEVQLDVGSTATGGPWNVTLDLRAPPLAIVEDAGYAARRDANSAHYYRISSSDYAQLFEIAPFATDTGVRLFHYVVTNPGPVDVVLSGSFPANSWGLTEQWSGYKVANVGPTGHSNNSTCFPAEPCSHSQSGFRAAGASTWACGNSSTYPTATPPPATARTVSMTGLPLLKAYVGGAPALDGASRIVVPRAANGAPGLIDLYVDRPIVTSRNGWPVLGWNPAPATGIAASFTVPFGRTLAFNGTSTIGYCNSPSTIYLSNWAGADWGQRLVSATERITGSLTLRSSLTSGVGVTSTVAVLDLSDRSIAH